MSNQSKTKSTTRFELLIGLHVIDDNSYDQYRAGMTPILDSFGGYFRFDFRVSEMLKGEADDPFNRVFILSFPDQVSKEKFFADEAYKAVRAAHFDQAVRSVQQIAQYHT
ncbi:MAG: DUF1330 domain-containing protein [Phycisphaerales bacterium]|nr:DUF1330 domain-containing protein [Phycisphaerales bacterium]